MKTINRKTNTTQKKFDGLLGRLVIQEARLKTLPALTAPKQAKLDTNRAIDHLYYSSKIEGTHLTPNRIERAIHGHTLHQAKN